uniref:Putative single-stranded DNA-binding protein n=1 Tax=viral metagenome TaxID=1070528 RepID=A0A6M3JIZ3_9ZZZZ
MASLNKVQIIGNLGTSVEMRFTPNGKPVTSFAVACNDKRGETEHTEWFNVVAWNKLAETCNQYLSKGRQVYVEGRQQTRTWTGNDDKPHYKVELIAEKVVFLGKKSERTETNEPETDESEIPF